MPTSPDASGSELDHRPPLLAAAGWLGAFIHLSTPWTYRISIIAYAEGGLSFYLAATTLSGFWILDAIHERILPLPGYRPLTKQQQTVLIECNRRGV